MVKSIGKLEITAIIQVNIMVQHIISDNEINQFILLLRKVFILMSIRMIGKILMKQHYLKKKNFIAT